MDLQPKMNNLTINVKGKLDDFIANNEDIIPKITEEQKDRWVKNIIRSLILYVDDSDLYFDNMPEDVIID